MYPPSAVRVRFKMAAIKYGKNDKKIENAKLPSYDK